MLFNSIPFLLFAFVFFAIWPLMRKGSNRKWLWITAMSVLFYAWWDWRFVFLLIATGSVDYFCGLRIADSKANKKLWLWFSVVSNLGSLAIFKYSEWLAGILNQGLSAAGIEGDFNKAIPQFSLVLPIGISFYTFNSLSYALDLYRGKAEKAASWLHFMAFISFFPHLVAGPIIRARDVLQQLNRNNTTGSLQVYNGIKTCIWGLFQKMVLADNLAVMVNARFADINSGSGMEWWFCMTAFAFQIYFDFNGYSTIARGLAKICGIHFRLNFNHPYRSASFGEFWKRWHISLSSFFRDYVYISLGGNRRGVWRTEFNRWITMLLSGLWHGANSTFLIWGAIHAFYLSAESMLKKLSLFSSKRIRPVSRVIVFTGIVLAWVFFRSETSKDALTICSNMFTFSGMGSVLELVKSNAFIWLSLAFLIEFAPGSFVKPAWVRNPVVETVCWTLLFAFTIYFRGPEQDFIYFQF